MIPYPNKFFRWFIALLIYKLLCGAALCLLGEYSIQDIDSKSRKDRNIFTTKLKTSVRLETFKTKPSLLSNQSLKPQKIGPQ